MSYRPYPDADRALAQVYRHASSALVLPVPEFLRPVVDRFARLRTGLRLAAPPVDEYRLSTR